MKADLDDGFARVSITLLYALPLFRLTGCEEAVIKLVMASAWGHATRSPGYTCDLTPVEMLEYLDGIFSQTSIYRAIQSLRDYTILTDDRETLTINPSFIEALEPQLLVRLRVMLDRHNSRKRYSRPELKPFTDDSQKREKNSQKWESHNKERVRGEREKRLKSSSNIAMNILENAVPNSQTADDDDFKAQSQRLRQELVRLAAQRARRPESEFAAQIDAVVGRTPQELALGMARLIDRMRANAIGAVANLRGLLANASDPKSTSWGAATPQSVLAAQPAAPAAPVIDQAAAYAESLRLEREARERRT